MLAFEVSLNGKILYVAGMDQWQYLCTRITATTIEQIQEPISLQTSIPGSDAGPPNQLYWEDQALRVGDTISVRIVDTDAVTTPIESPSVQQQLEQQLEILAGESDPE